LVILVSALTLLLALTPTGIKAHSASDLVLDYDSPNQILNFTVTHFVGDPNSHYISEAVILKNGASFDTVRYNSQPTGDTFKYTHAVPAVDGDVLRVTVTCNAFGSLTEQITVSDQIPDPEPGDDTGNLWVLHAILMTIGFILLLLTITVSTGMRKKKWWLKAHKSLGILGATFAVLGLLMGLYMVSTWMTPHFRVPHAFLGITTIILAIIQPVLGFMQPKSKKIRPVHRWLGRTVVILMFFSIIAGMSQAGVI
jgi:cytochrome b561